MGGTGTWRRGWTAWLAAGILLGSVAAQDASAQDGDSAGAASPVVRIRALDARSAAAVREGLARSATFRQLVAALDGSDVRVYVEIGSLRSGSLLSFMAVTPMGRLVRVSLNFRDVEPDTIGWLGHELRHAAEVAAARDVRDQKSLEQLYRRIGERSSSGGWCTRAAQDAGAAVRGEVLARHGAGQ
jgi:hypothetical protein